jgi:hypothetical protein
VLVTGVLAWQWALEAEKLKGVRLWHLVLACASSVLIWIVTWVHFRGKPQSGAAIAGRPMELLTVVLVVLTGHLGGLLMRLLKMLLTIRRHSQPASAALNGSIRGRVEPETMVNELAL